jgi:hypothetical protein
MWGEEEKLLLILTSALDGGEWSASRPGRALPLRKEPPVPTGQEAGWALEPVWTQRLEENPVVLQSHLIDWSKRRELSIV